MHLQGYSCVIEYEGGEGALRDLDESEPLRPRALGAAAPAAASQPSDATSGGATQVQPVEAEGRAAEAEAEALRLASECVVYDQEQEIAALKARVKQLENYEGQVKIKELVIRRLTNERDALSKRLENLKEQDTTIIALRRSVDSANERVKNSEARRELAERKLGDRQAAFLRATKARALPSHTHTCPLRKPSQRQALLSSCARYTSYGKPVHKFR